MRARDNPLVTDRVLQIRYRPQGTTWDELLAKLEVLHYRAAIVGPEGTGKTTLLEDLEPKLTARGFEVRWLRVQRPVVGADSIRDLSVAGTSREIILCDGADLLTRFAWHRLKHRARAMGGLIVTTHRSGLQPTLIECVTTPDLLSEILGDLLGSNAPSRNEAQRLFEKHHGNLRAALRELYDTYAAI